MAAFNAKVEAELHHEDESSIKWTDTSTEPPFIVGEPVSFVIVLPYLASLLVRLGSTEDPSENHL